MEEKKSYFYVCDSCDDVIVGSLPCLVCAKKKISNVLKERYYFKCLLGLDVPVDLLKIISSYAVEETNTKHMINVHNCCFKTSTLEDTYVPILSKKVNRKLF